MSEGITKKEYEKPSVKKVKLVIDEAVLQHCKTSNGAAGQGAKWCGHNQCRRTYGS